MKKILWIFLFTLSINVQAQASDWRYLVDSFIMMDVNSIQKTSSQTYLVWIKLLDHEDETFLLKELDFKNRKEAWHEGHVYRKGELLESYNFDTKNLKWFLITPDSMGEKWFLESERFIDIFYSSRSNSDSPAEKSTPPNFSGTWQFSEQNSGFSIIINQSGKELSGTLTAVAYGGRKIERGAFNGVITSDNKATIYWKGSFDLDGISTLQLDPYDSTKATWTITSTSSKNPSIPTRESYLPKEGILNLTSE